MQHVEPIDAGDAIRRDMEPLCAGASVHTAPLPDSPGMPCVCVTVTGGSEVGPVAHQYLVSVDAWASTPGAAIALASRAYGAFRAMEGGTGPSGHQCKLARGNTPPYPNPDPRRPEFPRASFTATAVYKDAIA